MPTFNRWEYRNEYLKSDHWKNLRKGALARHPKCFLCKRRKSTDVHHTRYGDIYTVDVASLLGLCRPCHELVERAKKMGFIPKEHLESDVLKVSEEAMEAFLAKRNEKIVLEMPLMLRIDRASDRRKMFICGIMGLPQPGSFTDWVGIITTRAKLKHIFWTLEKYGPQKRKFSPSIPKAKRVKIHY